MPTKSSKKKPSKRETNKKLKEVVSSKKAELEKILSVPTADAEDKIIPSDQKPSRPRRFEKHDRVDSAETQKRIAQKSLIKAEKMLESMNAKEMSPQQKINAYDILIRSARLIFGETTENVGKVDLRVVALKVLDDRMKGKKAPKNDDASNKPINAEYSENEILDGPETIHAKD